MNPQLEKAFQSPGSAYRGKPFWAWNGKLEPEELRRQVRLMHRMGLGGFFMHSRVGLNTAYLSKDWFDCVKACIDEARKLGMEAWLYDEDRWPSGAAGGLVTKNPKFRMRPLLMRRFEDAAKFRWTPATLAAFTGKVDGSKAGRLQQIQRGKRPEKLARGQCVLAFEHGQAQCGNWYNGFSYLDTLSHEAVRKFIEVTHEAYRKQVGGDFGKLVPGIFTDEPNYGGACDDRGEDTLASPWTRRLPEIFRERYGYDLLPRLPEVFLEVEGVKSPQARYHYYDCITHLFVDAFGRQIFEWCRKHGIQFTGHVLEEDSPARQTHVVGDAMRFYEYMQAPGMDLLTEHWRIYDTAKQVSSAARQFGRKWRLTETYGCTGWDFPFAGHKALGDWQTALGINLRCQHLSWYTMEGEAKRDYPAGIFYQSPWWELYPKVEDYFARVLAVMTQGVEVRDLLVIHPIESMWTVFKKGWRKDQDMWRYDNMLAALRDSLLAEKIDFDYGNEELLAQHGRVMKSVAQPPSAGAAQARPPVPLLALARGRYKAVVVPPLKTIRASTLRLLQRFKDAGGLVVFAGGSPRLVDALPSNAATKFARTCRKAPAKGKALADTVAKTCRRVSIATRDGKQIAPALYLLREDKEAFYLFVCNTGHEPRQLKPDNFGDCLARERNAEFPDVRIRGFAECAGAPVEFDPNTGQRFVADARRVAVGQAVSLPVRQAKAGWTACSTRGAWEIRTSLPKLGSRLFVIPKKAGRAGVSPRPKLRDVRRSRIAGERWEVVLSESNNLVLDRPRYKIADGKWQGPEEILRVDRAVREALGVPARGGGMCQPWAREKLASPKTIPVQLAYTLNVETIPSGDLFLAIEQPQTFRITLNGVPVSTDAECGWWTDLSLRKVPVSPALLRKGQNELALACDYRQDHPGFEIIYLLGNFGAKVSPPSKGGDTEGVAVTMTRPSTALKLGDWVGQGLAFYSGNVAYCRTIRPRLRKGQRLFVQVPDYRGVAVRVLVDGKSAGVIAWEPNEIDLTAFVKGEPLDLRIEVIGHRRNSHGPFHLTEKWPHWTGPGEFAARGDRWFDGYQRVPCGLMAAPILVTRR